MDIPDLVTEALGDEDIQAGVSLGDEDAVCLTETRTIVYRGEGLLSDEQIEEYSHNVERLQVSEGRRKTKFVLEYIEGTETFTVPSNRGEKVLELLLEGVLRLEGVIDQRESLVGVYRFSELTVIVAEGRLIKHIGEQVWNEDYEVYPFEDATGLEFERGSVATSVAISIEGRPQRIKVPNDTAPVFRQTLERALFAYYDVGSLDELNRVIAEREGTDPGAETASGANDDGDDFEFGDDFDPLVSDDEDITESVDADDPLATDAGESAANEGASTADEGASVADSPNRDAHPDAGTTGESATNPASGGQSTAPSNDERDDAARGDQRSADAPTDEPSAGQPTADRPTTDQPTTDRPTTDQQNTEPSTADPATTDPADSRRSAPDTPSSGASAEPSGAAERSAESHGRGGAGASQVGREEFEAVAERLDELTEAVDRQNELLKRQHRAIKQLIKQQQSE